MSDQQEGAELKRGLKNRHIQLIALGGAIGTGLFLGIAQTIKMAGPRFTGVRNWGFYCVSDNAPARRNGG